MARNKDIHIRMSTAEIAELDALGAELGKKRADTIMLVVNKHKDYLKTNATIMKFVGDIKQEAIIDLHILAEEGESIPDTISRIAEVAARNLVIKEEIENHRLVFNKEYVPVPIVFSDEPSPELSKVQIEFLKALHKEE